MTKLYKVTQYDFGNYGKLEPCGICYINPILIRVIRFLNGGVQINDGYTNRWIRYEDFKRMIELVDLTSQEEVDFYETN